MAQQQVPERTTLSLRGKTHRRFRDEKPDGLSSDEFVRVLLNRWEGSR